MTVVTQHPGAVGSGRWTDFTVASLAVAYTGEACAYLDSSVIGAEGFLQSASAFGFAIPADATITSFIVEGRWKTSGEGSIALTPSQGEAATDGGNVPDWTVIQGVTYTALPTVAQLNSAAFTVTAHATRPMGEISWVYLDYIRLTVEYDEYVPPEPDPDPPTVGTWSIVAITPTTAQGGGNITSAGGAPVTDRGICVGTSPEPRTPSVDAGVGAGEFICSMTGLTPGTRYYVAAFAENVYGRTYGGDVIFDTPQGTPTLGTWSIIAITATTAQGGGNITSAGYAAVTYRGICVSTSPNPRTPSVSGGVGTGEFICVMTGLAPGTRYYVAAFAQNQYGTTYGADVTFVTHGVPTIATAGIYDITATTASGGGNVSSDNGEAVTTRGVCWSVEENPTTAANIIPAMTSATAPSGVATSSGDYGAAYAAWKAFDHLTTVAFDWVAAAGTTGYLQYQFPAAHAITRYAVTSRSEGAGLQRAPKSWYFKGSNDGATWTTLDTQTNITDWAASSNVRKVFGIGNATAYAYYRLDITASNDASYVGVGELEMMEAADDDTLDGSDLGAFVSHLTGLTEGITYNVRAYAVNAVGIAYGVTVIFTAIADAPPVEPPPGPPRDPSQNLLFDGTLELKVGTLDVAGSVTQVKYSNSNPGGFGNLSFRLPANDPYAAFDAQVVKGAAVTMKHGLVGFAATLFEGEVTSDVSHATIAGGKGYYDVTCAGLWWAAGQRKDFSMVVGDDDYGQWFTMDDNAKAFQVSTDGCLEIRLAAGQSAAAGDSASLYYWLGKGMGDLAATIDFLFGLLACNVAGANWVAKVLSAPTPWGTWTECIAWTDGSVAASRAECVSALGDNPQALKLELSTTSAVDAMAEDRFVRLDNVAVGSGVSANGLSAVSAANPAVVTSTSAHGLRSGDRVFITQSAASTPTISGWRTVTVTDGGHFTVPVAVTTAGGAGTFYKATRIDQALVEIAVTTGLATRASLQPGGIGNLNWGLVVRPHASRAGGIDLLAATNVAPFDYGFWDNKTFRCQDRPETIPPLHDYLIDSSLPGIDFDVRQATEDSPTVVKVLYKFRAEDGETSTYPDGTALAVYRDAGGVFTGDWTDAGVVLDVWNEWADLSLTTAQAGDLGDQILAWLSANAYQGGGSIAPATVPLRAEVGGQPGVVAGAVLELHAAKAALGTSPGVNDPLTTQFFDTSWNGNHGTLTNFAGTPWQGAGMAADPYRLVFDGSNDRVMVSHVAGLAFGADFTVELRTMGLVAVGGWFWMCYKGAADAPNYGVEVMIAAQQTSGTLGNLRACVGPWFTDAATHLTVTDWALPHDVVLTRRAGYCHLYIDGVEPDAGNASTQDLSTVTGAWNIGGSPSFDSLLGGLVLLRQYDFGFTAEQVAQNNAAGPLWTSPESTKPVAYIRGGDYIEDVNLDTGPLMITGFSMDADRGVATIAIGENRRAFVERLTPDKA